MRSLRLLPLVLLIACGDNKGGDSRPDSGRRDGGGPDAPPPVPCSFNEMADATNDDFFGNGTAEATGHMFTGGAYGMCGKIDIGHYDQQRMLVDLDAYRITVPAQSSGVIWLTGTGAEALDTVLIEIYSITPGEDAVGEFVGTFAMASTALPPGDYAVQVMAFHGAAPAAAIDYKLVVEQDDPARCARVTATADYSEMLDGATADGNDVYEVRYSGGGPRRVFTALATDVPEPTGLTVAPDEAYRITGTNIVPAAVPASWADFYQDRDTYQITVGTTTNTLSLRLNWPGTTADLDFLVFPEMTISDFMQGYDNRAMEPEFETSAVTPGASYWVFVGADDTSTGQPITYDLTVCGGTFTPR